MKKGVHPENYRLVAFKDMSNEDVFITKSTVETKETIILLLYSGLQVFQDQANLLLPINLRKPCMKIIFKPILWMGIIFEEELIKDLVSRPKTDKKI